MDEEAAQSKPIRPQTRPRGSQIKKKDDSNISQQHRVVVSDGSNSKRPHYNGRDCRNPQRGGSSNANTKRQSETKKDTTTDAGVVPKQQRPQQQRQRPKGKARSKMGGYAPHAKLSDILPRYAANATSNDIIRGKIRMLPGKDAAAFVTCDKGMLDRDVVICTTRDQNRALDGDTVYVELLPPDEVDDDDDNVSDASDDESDNDADDEIDDITEQMDRLSSIEHGDETWQDDSIQKSLWDPLVKIRRIHSNAAGGTEKNDDKLQRKGRVVYVVHPKETAGNQPSELGHNCHVAPRRTIVGTMQSIKPKDGKPLYLLSPNSKVLPQFLCPHSFKPESDQEGLYRAEYVYGSWNEKHNWPPCVNVKQMGRTCNVQDETLALLVENGVDHGDFPAAVLKDVQEAVESGLILESEDLGWKPTPEMYQGRRDYRKQRIFTIDPTTAKDLDDALHITQLPDGRVEIGVHIADVSYFIKPETAVDDEAARRATTVYLVDRVIPMLPRPLCEVACSLNENVERLAFSCVWRMNMDGTLEPKTSRKGDEVWYGRSVIKSCARLDYATAQNIIDGKVGNGESPSEMQESLWPKSRQPTGGHTIDEVAADVRLMHKVAMARRRLRFVNGAIALNGVKLSFKLGSDGETPDICAPYPIRDSNRLVEEYMLLANYLVAQRLITNAGPLALLRHHPAPLEKGIDDVIEIAKAGTGFSIDSTSSQSLQASLSRMGRECDDELVMQCITELLMTPMRPAEYMAAGTFSEEEWRHFALNIPYYTHFTSPIRRYADVIVHRLLQATIDNAVDDFPMEQREIQAVSEHCNEKKMASKKAQDRSDRIFLAVYLKKNPLRGKLGVVLSVGERTFTVFIQELGCSGKLFLDEHKQMVDSESYTAKNGQRHIKLTNKRSGGLWSDIDIKVFAKIKVSVHCKERPPIDLKVQLEGPWHD